MPGRLAVGFIGAGNYATSMLLPHLARNSAVRLTHVATTRSLSAVNAQQRFGFTTASTSADAVLEDTSLDAIFIVTRHHTHADLVCRALETGKAVFVEKPLALTRDETERILDAVENTGNDRLMVGFNRRFAPLLTDMRARFGPQAAAASTRYLVNAGRLDASSWYLNEELEGSRFTGEGGHFIDTLSWWADSLPDRGLRGLRDRPGRHPGRSCASPTGRPGPSAMSPTGNSRYPKETLDAGGGGCSARLDNFSQASVWAGRKRSNQQGTRRPGQGPAGRSSRPSSRPCGPARRCRSRSSRWWRRRCATIAVGESLASGRPERV